MHVWNSEPGTVRLQCGPLRPHVFGARLYLLKKGKAVENKGAVQADGTVVFDVSASDVGIVGQKEASLLLTTRHFLHVGAADLRWGWRYRVLQNGTHLLGEDADGLALSLDENGYWQSGLEKFDLPVATSAEAITFD